MAAVRIVVVAEDTPQGLDLHLEGPENPVLFLGLLEMAKGRILDSIKTPVEAPQILVPPPGLKVHRNGN